MIKEFKAVISGCKSTDEKMEAICKFVGECSGDKREAYINEHFGYLKKRIIKEDYINNGYYFRLVFNYVIRPIKPLARLIHKDYPDEYFEGRAFWLFYKEHYLHFLEEILNNIGEYRRLYDVFADDRSRDVLTGLLLCRLTGDRQYCYDIKDEGSKQYLDEAIVHADREVFADVGGYHGESTIAFKEYSKGIPVRSYIFEMEKNNADYIRGELGDDPEMILIEKGCGDEPCTVYYEGSGTMATITDHETDNKAEISTIDIEVKEKITYVKMDVEGAERSVLLGAKDHIVNDKPRLAVCVYHKPGDFWSLYDLVNGFGVPYKYYLRQYDPREKETVLYAVYPGSIQ